MGGTELDPQEDTQALLGLVESNDLEGVEKLLGEETKTHVNDELLGVTPLMIASSLGYVDVVEALVSERPISFRVGSKTLKSNVAHTYALAQLERKADVAAKDMDGKTAYSWPSCSDSSSVPISSSDAVSYTHLTLPTILLV